MRRIFLPTSSRSLPLLAALATACGGSSDTSPGDVPADVSASDTLAGDTAAEDATAEDATAEDASAEDATAEDATAEDATAEDATAEDATAEDATAEDATAEDGPGTDADATSADTTAPAPLTVGFRLLDTERGVDVTADGRTALLWQQSTGELYFYDTASSTLTRKTTLDLLKEIQTQQPHALSSTGRIAAGYGFQPGHAGLWDEPTGWKKLGTTFDGGGCLDTTVTPAIVTELGAAFDVSADGAVAVGFLWESCSSGQAFRWTDASGAGAFTMLDRVGSPGFERATVVSADGSIAAGFATNTNANGTVDRSPAWWGADGHGALLDKTNTTEPGEVTAISADGSVLAGTWAGATGGQAGFTWTKAGGTKRFTVSSVTPERDSIYVNAMTADGGTLFGSVSTLDPDTLNTTQDAYFRHGENPVTALADRAAISGVTIPEGHTLSNVMAASADGTVILGEVSVAAPPNDPLGFPSSKVYLLVLPEGTFQ